MSKIKVASLFAGIGGIDLGFKLAGAAPIWANEIDKNSAETFLTNHKGINLVIDDINNITSKDIPDIDIMCGGFPCQPFSVAGNRKGFDDDRGNLFFQIMRLVEEMSKENRKPRVIFLENVKNMFTHNNNQTYIKMKEKLNQLGYHVTEKILNTCEYGNIPQNRERLYIIAFSNMQSRDSFEWPEKIELTNTIDKVIDWSGENVNSKYYYTEKNKCWDLVSEGVDTTGSIYQFRRVYVRQNKSNLCPTLTANMGTGGHNVPLIRCKNNKIRKLTPKECLLLQGFPTDFIIPSNQADSKIYKQAGNSVSINVIKRIAENILSVINNEEE